VLGYLQVVIGVHTKSWSKLFKGKMKDREIYCSALLSPGCAMFHLESQRIQLADLNLSVLKFLV
jgi:hypothetical protein